MAGNDPKTAVVSERTVDTDETTALLAQVANGDSAALSSLYDDYSGLLMSVIVSVLKNKAESEDVLQETFVTIWKKANMYQTHLGKASSWMVTIAKNKAYDRYRKLVRTSDGIESLKEAEVEKVTEVKSSADEALGRCFNLLNEGQKMAIGLVFYEGYTQQEACEQLSTPLGTLKARVRRGLIQLKSCLEISKG